MDSPGTKNSNLNLVSWENRRKWKIIMVCLHRFFSPEIQIHSVLQAIKADTERLVLI